VEQFSGAMTNMVYRCGLLQGGKEVQVRLLCRGLRTQTAVSASRAPLLLVRPAS
jgi:hypothetical protein